MKRLDWRAFAALGVLAVILHFLASSPGVQGVIYLTVGAAGVLAVVVGIRRHRPAPAYPWYLFAAGLLLFLIGDGFFYFYKLVRHVERPFPSLADAFYLASYPVLIAGLLGLIRRRIPGGDRPSLIDASIIATGMALLWELFLIAPFLASPDTPWLERAISAAYPVADVALLAVALRLAVGAGSRVASFLFVGLGISSLLAADIVY
ncbi:MAG TPA: hypothetical protein VFO65_04505, partial [Acidimicrobiales bacterium]|nr:hypothetical protein [Acidimicrobiales bacterium]